ncbi:MAG: transketolase [Mycobacteriales bacterium]
MLPADGTAAVEYRALRSRVSGSDRQTQAGLLRDVATDTRRAIVRTISHAGLGHVGGDLSVTDILVSLFVGVLRVDPANPSWPERDRFILSKGHCAVALYTVLSGCGFFARSELGSFAQPLSALNGHPNRTEVPGVETNTGPLGHGFPVAVGAALAAKLQGSPRRTVVVMGDGEMQEGSNWEAAMTASHYDLAALTAVVDRNRLQQGARTEETKRLEPLADKWRAFGWEVREVDGHDYEQLLDAFGTPAAGRPVAVIANTVKGKGVSFMEDRVEWHHKVPDAEQTHAALAELSA